MIPLSQIEDIALPLYQGVMFNALRPSAKSWVSGTGLKAVWNDVFVEEAQWGPQYLLGITHWNGTVGADEHVRLGYREVARSTDTRTFIASPLPPFPCGHKVPILRCAQAATLAVAASAASFVVDWLVREKLGATALAWFFLQEVALPGKRAQSLLSPIALRVGCSHPTFAPLWQDVGRPAQLGWRRLWAITPTERVRLRAILDAAVADLLGLDEGEFGWILRDCDHPMESVCDARFARTLDPKGFWRVDKEKAPELRHPVLSLIAFHDLKTLGLENFLSLSGGDGWQLPETVRLADYGLGHDDRAKEHQPVAAALGERFLPWQLGEDVEASWEECRRHAELIEKILARGRDVSTDEAVTVSTPAGGGTQLALLGEAHEMRLVPKKTRGRKR
jgi:hypothetical protein